MAMMKMLRDQEGVVEAERKQKSLRARLILP